MSTITPAGEMRRIDEKLSRERAGTWRPPPLSAVTRTYPGKCDEILPREPFVAWLADLLRRAPAHATHAGTPYAHVAKQLKVSNRRVWEWVNGKDVEIRYSTVDRAASRHGGTTVEEIYWTYGNMTIQSTSDGRFAFVITHWAPIGYDDGPPVQRVPKRETCRTPGCRQPQRLDSKWCPEHAVALARVRESLEADSKAFRSTIGRKNMGPTCCNQACREPRLPSERYCTLCQEEADARGEEEL